MVINALANNLQTSVFQFKQYLSTLQEAYICPNSTVSMAGHICKDNAMPCHALITLKLVASFFQLNTPTIFWIIELNCELCEGIKSAINKTHFGVTLKKKKERRYLGRNDACSLKNKNECLDATIRAGSPTHPKLLALNSKRSCGYTQEPSSHCGSVLTNLN